MTRKTHSKPVKANIKRNNITMKISIIAILILLTVSLSTNAQLSLGLKGGIDMSNMIGTNQGEPYYYSSAKPGYHIGISLYSALPNLEQVEIESGIFIENKGFSIDHEKTIDEDSYSFFRPRPNFPEGNIKFNILYLTIPATVKINFNSFYVNTGFYISNALNAKSKIEDGELKEFYEENNSDTEREMIIGYNYEDDEILSPYDFGLIFGLGYTIESISISLSYDYGMYDVSTSQEEDATLKNRVFKLSLSYRM